MGKPKKENMELLKNNTLEKEIKNMRKPVNKDQYCLYAMGKEAHHKLGDISRDEYDLIQVFEEDEDNCYGNWLTGYGYVDVRFPKTSVRPLTKKEIDKWEGTKHGISGQYLFTLKIKGALWG